MIGTSAHPESTLLDRVLATLRESARSATMLCHEVLGLPGAPQVICDRIAVALLGADPRFRRMPDGRWALVAEAQGSPMLDECAFAVVDVETTGTRASGRDRITEVAVVVVHGDRREVILDTLVNPERPIPPVVTAVTRITDHMVRSAPTFAELADQLLSALAGRIFVAHNARFDWGFLCAELRRARALTLEGQRLCTVRLARRLVSEVRSCGLDNLSVYFGIENTARHRAGGDAVATATLLAELLQLARAEGARTLQDLEAIEARRRKKKRRRPSAMPTPPRADSVPEAYA